MNRILRGDAVAIAQVWTATPANVEVGDVFRLAINGKLGVEYTATEASVANVTAGLAAAWNASVIAEFTEITAADLGTHLTLTADAAGTPFHVTATTVNSAAGNVTVAETVKGVEAVNEVQRIALVGTYSGGTFTLSIDLGSGTETTSDIAWNASAATVKAAIEGLASVNPGDVVVTGGPGPNTPWFVTWTGAYAATEVLEFDIDGTNLTGNGDVVVETLTEGGAKSDEIVGYTIRNAAGGTYTITFGGQTTGAIPYDATAATIQTALEALSTIGAGNVLVYGGGSQVVNWFRFYILFTGDLAGVNVGSVNFDDGNLAGDGDPADIQGGALYSGAQPTRDEFQLINLGQPSGGTFTLTFGGQTTTPIDWDTVGAGIVGALEALSNIGVGDIQVLLGHASSAPSGDHFLVRFQGNLANTDVAELVLNHANLTGKTGTPGVTTIHPGGGEVDEVQSVTVIGTGGTFSLTFSGQTTVATAWDASAATLEANLEALSNVTDVTVSGSGTPTDPYIVTFLDPGAENVLQMTGNAGSLTGGGGTVTEVTPHGDPVNEQQTVTIGAGVTGGTFTLSFGGVPTSNIPYNADAASVEAALEALSTIAGVSVSGGAGGPWTVTFDAAPLSGQDLPLLGFDAGNLLGGSGSETLTIAETIRSGGPNHFDSPRNWTGNRVPDSGDDVIVDALDVELLYGLRQRTTFTADAGSDLLTFGAEQVAFVEDQVLRLRTTGTLPSGLSEDTDYYVIQLDHLAGTCKLSLTSGGAAVNITDAGTGIHTIALELGSLTITNRYEGLFGLPLRTDTDYWQYRPGYFEFGLLSPAGGVNRTVTIGNRDGSGSGRIKLDLAGYAVDVVVYDTGGSVEPGVNACLLLLDHASANVTFHEGDLGLAVLAAETAALGDYTQYGGNCEMGTVALGGDFARHGGEFVAEQLTMSGSMIAR